MMFIIFSVVSIITLVVSILVDHTTANSVTNERDFLIPVYAYILIVMMYRDFYPKKNNTIQHSYGFYVDYQKREREKLQLF